MHSIAYGGYCVEKFHSSITAGHKSPFEYWGASYEAHGVIQTGQFVAGF